uniref:uncharacterized protein LOC120337701 n=1 Tax=Styela clava TaxID=7725 RepID=UPI00193A4FA6|nr:uncharacterized protein LOC120337701 [Styela clava]
MLILTIKKLYINWYRRYFRPRWKMYKIIKKTIFFILICGFTVKFLMVPTEKHHRDVASHNLTYHYELVRRARQRAGCRQPDSAEGYVVCDRLPYTDISCGGCKKGCPVADPSGKHYLVPDIVHFIWFGPKFNVSQYYQYLALRSVASIQRPSVIKIHYNSDVFEGGKIWGRIRREIPCIEMVKMRAPDDVFEKQIDKDLFKSDVARLQILKEQGGIYLDFDVITLKSLDPIRIHQSAVGRSKSDKASNGIIFSEQDSTFINVWINMYKSYDPVKRRSLAFWGLVVPYSIYLENKETNIVHMDEILFNRPNPYLDGLDSTTSAHFSVEDNYFLHIHPKAILETEYDIKLDDWDDERLRTFDSVYGQAARIALFGSPDLVYREGEFYRKPYPKRKAKPLAKDNPLGR